LEFSLAVHDARFFAGSALTPTRLGLDAGLPFLARNQRDAVKYGDTCGRTWGASPVVRAARLGAFSHQEASDPIAVDCAKEVAK
jgi:hypothetical protein